MPTFASVSPQTKVSNSGVFIPDIWSDEIIATYEANLVIAPKVRKMSMKGKKGDVIHVPMPARGAANKKVAETAVTLNAVTNTEIQINISEHFEYSRMIEDIVDVQAISSLRRFYTEDAGYAMAYQVDKALLGLAPMLGSVPSLDAEVVANNTKANWAASNSVFQPGSGGNLVDYDGTVAPLAFTDVTMRAAIQKLDDADVPMSNRYFIQCPALANVFRGVDRYSSSDFVNSGKVPGGSIGEIYGVEIYQSTNVYAPTDGATNRMNLLFHKDAFVLAEQQGVRTQTQYKQEHLATLMTADRIYGKRVYRPANGITIATV